MILSWGLSVWTEGVAEFIKLGLEYWGELNVEDALIQWDRVSWPISAINNASFIIFSAKNLWLVFVKSRNFIDTFLPKISYRSSFNLGLLKWSSIVCRTLSHLSDALRLEDLAGGFFFGVDDRIESCSGELDISCAVGWIGWVSSTDYSISAWGSSTDCSSASSWEKSRKLTNNILFQFPHTGDDWKIIASDFEKKWNFPHCLGALDGKHI